MLIFLVVLLQLLEPHLEKLMYSVFVLHSNNTGNTFGLTDLCRCWHSFAQ